MRAQHTHQEPGVTICVPRCQTSSHSPQVGEPLCLVLVTILVTLATNCRVVNQPHLYGYNRAFFPHDVTPLMQSACQSAARRPRASLVPGAGRIARRMPKGPRGRPACMQVACQAAGPAAEPNPSSPRAGSYIWDPRPPPVEPILHTAARAYRVTGSPSYPIRAQRYPILTPDLQDVLRSL